MMHVAIQLILAVVISAWSVFSLAMGFVAYGMFAGACGLGCFILAALTFRNVRLGRP